MRDKRFVAVHRGGSLEKEQHRLLMNWARKCAEHILPLLGDTVDERLSNALMTAAEWEKGNVTVGVARNAALDAISVAGRSSNPVTIAVARSVGHAVATAHMADHSLGAASYALKAIKSAGKSTDSERTWQNEQLPSEIRELVLAARSMKEKNFKI